jgi:AmmeMemoRadiSam system protein B
MTKKIRKALFAGSWYQRYKPDLLRSLKSYFTDSKFGPGEEPKSLNKEERTIIGGVSPHAGYEYSGCCAAHTYLNLFREKIPDTVIVLGTDHQGYGKVGLMEEGSWETPLGNLPIDSQLSKEILKNGKIIVADDAAFEGFPFGREHNIEIQLPFIKYCAKDKNVQIVTIKITPRINYEQIDALTSDIVNAISNIKKDIVIVASSDMSHKSVSNESDLKAFKEFDQEVINEFSNLNPKKTMKSALKTTVCGPQTITSSILICMKLNANKGKLLQYYTSSEKTGQWGYCVGYFSGVIIK